ncbi:MAG: amino acid transport protein [Pseudomonadota bacterium]
MDATTLFAGVLFSSIGMGYFIYGKKQKKGIPLIAGLSLCVIPYFVSNTLLLTAISILLIALPFIIKL